MKYNHYNQGGKSLKSTPLRPEDRILFLSELAQELKLFDTTVLCQCLDTRQTSR